MGMYVQHDIVSHLPSSCPSTQAFVSVLASAAAAAAAAAAAVVAVDLSLRPVDKRQPIIDEAGCGA